MRASARACCDPYPACWRAAFETTKNIYGHLFAQDRALILDAMNQAVSRLYAYENEEPGEGEGNDAVA